MTNYSGRMIVRRRTTPMARIEANSTPIPESGCFVFLGCLSHDGYGKIGIDGRTQYVHRVAYEHFIGPIPDGADLDHKCRVRSCWNPQHLDPVTRSENLRRGDGKKGSIAFWRAHDADLCDMVASGLTRREAANRLGVSRHAIQRRARVLEISFRAAPLVIPRKQGEDTGNAKLTNQQVIEICRRLDNGERITDLAPEYNVTIPTLSLIKNGLSWVHLTAGRAR
jgi:HNH endonuclease